MRIRTFITQGAVIDWIPAHLRRPRGERSDARGLIRLSDDEGACHLSAAMASPTARHPFTMCSSGVANEMRR